MRRATSKSFSAWAIAAVLWTATTVAAAALPGPQVGEVPPTYLGTTVERQPISIKDYAGRVVIVTFWASWCPPCRKELPILNAIQEKVGTDQLRVVAINVEEWTVFRKAASMLQKLSVQLSSDASGTASAAYGVRGYPHMVIVGRDGRMLASAEGYDDEELDHLLGEINTALAAPRPTADAKQPSAAGS